LNATGLPEVLFSACDVGRLRPYLPSILGINACKVSGAFNIYSFGSPTFGSCLVTQIVNLQGMCGAGTIFSNDTLFALGARLVVFSQGALLERVAIFDVPGATTDAILVSPAASLRATNPFGVGEAVYGSGNGRAGINCAGSGLFQYRANKPTITG